MKKDGGVSMMWEREGRGGCGLVGNNKSTEKKKRENGNKRR